MPRRHINSRYPLMAVGILLLTGTVWAQDRGKAAAQPPKTMAEGAPVAVNRGRRKGPARKR